MNSLAAPGDHVARVRHWQLPAEVSGFVGREDELARLSTLLNGARLVTVTGPGGVGKTRLALRAAAGAAATDGTCLIELSGLSRPEMLTETTALRLGLPLAGQGLAPVLDALRGLDLLLIFDTCEHLAAECARLIAAVLRETPNVRVLTTSRQPLHVPGEQVLRLGPLPVPDDDAGCGRPRAAGDAVELFLQRAEAAVSGFRPVAEALPDVIRLCRRLDGLPLAIELAAVRVRALPVAELAARVEAGPATVTGAKRGTVSRHQTLPAAIGWSYALCTAEERAAWRRLSVFTGTFDLADARDVISGRRDGDPGPPSERVALVLGQLADKSVLLPVRGDRYRLLGSFREYGAQRLTEAGEVARFRQRHLARYLGLARNFSRHLVSDEQQDRLSQLRAEHANIRGALEYALLGSVGANPDPAAAAASARAAAKLAAELYPYWVMSGSISEGMRWQDRVLRLFAEPSPERASALANLSLLGTTVGVPDAVRQAAEAVAMAARVGDERTQARGYLALQFALTTVGRHQEALEVAAQARSRLEALGTDHALRTLDLQLALTHLHAGDPDTALEHARRLMRGLAPGERWLRGNGHVLCALAHYQQSGRQSECETAATAALRETHEIGYLVGEAYSLEVLAWLAADAGRYQRAAWLLGAARALWERSGGRLSGSTVLEGYHQRSAAAAAGSLGADRYAELRADGAARPLPQIVALAVSGADVLPEPTTASADDPAGSWEDGDLLTSREREIAVLVARGLSNKDIAERLVISKRTVDAHVNHIFGKLGLTSRVQLTIWLRDRAARRPAPLPSR